MSDFKDKMHQCTKLDYIRLLAGFNGPTSKGRGGKGRGMEEEREGEGEDDLFSVRFLGPAW